MSWDRAWVDWWDQFRKVVDDRPGGNLYNAAFNGYIICMLAKWASGGDARAFWQEAELLCLILALVTLAAMVVAWLIEKGIDAIYGR